MGTMNGEVCCGKVTSEERDEIRRLFRRKIALTELFGTIDPQRKELYERVLDDMGQTMISYQKWFELRANQYSWPASSNGKWRVDFDSCEVFLN